MSLELSGSVDRGLRADRAACETLRAFPGGQSLVFLAAKRFGVIKASPCGRAGSVLCAWVPAHLGALGKLLHIHESSAFQEQFVTTFAWCLSWIPVSEAEQTEPGPALP